ncbi:MAG: hypothetical protein ACFE9S_10370 [Candidatus Hermodarchaeota archaeon]
MKPIFEEFYCPQCREIRYINVDGICFDCNNENKLMLISELRKNHKLDILNQSLSVEI